MVFNPFSNDKWLKIRFLLTCFNWNIQDPNPTVTAIEVVGVVRGSEKPSIFVPENDPGYPQWFYVDVPAIARASGLPEDTLYMEDINENVNPGNPYPIQKDVNTLIRSSVMPQDHLNYTLTWYALCYKYLIIALGKCWVWCWLWFIDQVLFVECCNIHGFQEIKAEKESKITHFTLFIDVLAPNGRDEGTGMSLPRWRFVLSRR